MKRAALARVLLARLLGGSLSQGSLCASRSSEVMGIIQDEKGRACARFTRSPTWRLAENWFHSGDPKKGGSSDGVPSSKEMGYVLTDSQLIQMIDFSIYLAPQKSLSSWLMICT